MMKVNRYISWWLSVAVLGDANRLQIKATLVEINVIPPSAPFSTIAAKPNE
jgi:hypothetical protein